MAQRSKINLHQMEALLLSGNTMEKVGEHFGCSKSAICKAVKKLKFRVPKDIALRSASAMQLDGKHPMRQLHDIMETVKSELDYIREALKNAQGDDRRRWEDMLIKNAAEIRQQLKLVQEIAEAQLRVEGFERFKQHVLAVITEESPECAKRIIERIRTSVIH
jgi:hypothetical protein